jgi:hypothetical protein
MDLHQRLPKITIATNIEFNKQHYTSTSDGEVPKEMADYSQQVMGNAQARVSITTDMAFKDFGNGAGVSTTITLSVNQDDATINNAVQTLGVWSREYCKQQLELARAEYEKLKS